MRPEDSVIVLTWADSSAVEDGYEVQRVSSREDQFRTIGRLPANNRGFRDSGLESNVSYIYRVRAKRGTTTSDWSDAAST